MFDVKCMKLDEQQDGSGVGAWFKAVRGVAL